MNGSMESTTEALEHIKFQLSLLRLTALQEAAAEETASGAREEAKLVKAMSELEREAERQRAS